MQFFRSLGHILGGSLLITGTMVGVGMLALPVATGQGGFVPAAIIYVLCWVFMLCTGLLLLEVCTWMPKDSNLITMAHRLLGPVGKNICWAVYLFLFVTVMIAHVVGGGVVFNELCGCNLPHWVSMIVYVLIFSPVVYLGTKWVERLNVLFMIGIIIAYFLFIAVSYEHVDTKLLARSDWPKAWLALPVLFTAFTFQVIIPTLMTYMNRNVKKVRLAIIIGTSLPLVIYLVWEFLILGIVPVEGTHGLAHAAEKGWNAIMPLKELIGNPIVFAIGKAFAFLTMTASYIALSLAYLDFLADGLKIAKRGFKKILLCLAIFVPPIIIAFTKPDIFITALSYAGGFSCAILFGLLPPVMVWVGRYIKKQKSNPQLPGGKLLLIVLIVFVFIELTVEIYQGF